MNNTILTVFKKEIIDLYRDKKTIIIGLLIPLLLFPVIFGVIGKSISGSQNSVQNNLKIELRDDGSSSLGKFIKSQKNFVVNQWGNTNSDINDGKIYLAVQIPKDFDEKISNEQKCDVKITYDNSSQDSSAALAIFNSVLEAYSKEIVNDRLNTRNIDTDILSPINITKTSIVKEEDGTAKLIISMLLPLLLVIYSVSGPLSSALDIGVGEKERGTLEPLLTTKAGRLSLLWGKFMAITVIGIQATIASIVGLYIAIKQNSSLFSSGSKGISSLSISVTSLLIICVLIIILTMSFGALELAISIYAKSFKEASTYTSPLMILAMIPTYATYMLDGKNIPIYYFSIPLANVTCILKELIYGNYNVEHLAITSGWIVVYVAASILFARYMFNREDVIFRT